ncbi:MAG: DUF4430 domain-containing protein [Minisyncoccia bacterium]
MNTKRIWQILGVLVLVLTFIGFFTFTNPSQTPDREDTSQIQNQTGTVSLTVEGLYQGKQTPVSSDETVLQILLALNARDPAMKLSTKEYSGLGTLVDGMGILKNGTDQKYWQYKVDGVMPQIGADAYTLKNGDSIEWFFDISQQ